MKKGRKIKYDIIAEFCCDYHPGKKEIEEVTNCIYNGAPICPECDEEMTLLDYYKKETK